MNPTTKRVPASATSRPCRAGSGRWHARAALFWLVGTFGCGQGEAEASVELGVFFGGQLQRLEEVARPTALGRERAGFRLSLFEGARLPSQVNWEITRPAQRLDGKLRPERTELGADTLAPGQREMVQWFPLEPTSPLGTWNFRVLLDGKLVLDRSLEVFDPSLRARASQR